MKVNVFGKKLDVKAGDIIDGCINNDGTGGALVHVRGKKVLFKTKLYFAPRHISEVVESGFKALEKGKK